MSEEAKTGMGGFAVGLALGVYIMGSTMKCQRVDPLEQEAVKRGHAEFVSPDPLKRGETEFRRIEKSSTAHGEPIRHTNP